MNRPEPRRSAAADPFDGVALPLVDHAELRERFHSEPAAAWRRTYGDPPVPAAAVWLLLASFAVGAAFAAVNLPALVRWLVHG